MTLKGKTILFFAGPLYEDLELWYPKIRLEEEGARTVVAGTGEKTYQGKRGYPLTVDTSVDQLDAKGWVPISAGIVKGRRGTSVGAIKDDLVNAGMLWEDSPVVVDGNLISSRTPADLPDFMRALIRCLQARQ